MRVRIVNVIKHIVYKLSHSFSIEKRKVCKVYTLIRHSCVWVLFTCYFCFCGCWATWSEVRKEKRLREALEEKFRVFKKKINKKFEANDKDKRNIYKGFGAMSAKIEVFAKTLKLSMKDLDKKVKIGLGGTNEISMSVGSLQRELQKIMGVVNELTERNKQILEGMSSQKGVVGKLKIIQKRYDALLGKFQTLKNKVDPAVRFNSARKLFRQRKYSRALKIFKGFYQDFSNHENAADALVYIGEIYSKKKKSTLAIRHFNIVLRKYKNNIPAVALALYNLGSIHYKKGQCRSGRKYFSRLMRYHRHQPKLAASGKRLYLKWKKLCVR